MVTRPREPSPGQCILDLGMQVNQTDKTRTGYLTVYSADGSEIYGEFADATWSIEQTDGGENHLFEGRASDGTMETFRRVNTEGIDHVRFDFEANGERFSGPAQLLRPGDGLVRVETGSAPLAGASQA
jgi:hypothetical protein